MAYSITSELALVLNLIINREAFKIADVRTGEQNEDRRAAVRYSYFLITANLYLLSDIIWGLLYEHHESDALFPFLYADSLLYFLLMFLTMLTWIRYIVAYLDTRGRRSKVMVYAVWCLFTLGLIYLIINAFYPFIFSFNENHEYIPESGRYIAFILQTVLYLATAVYMLYISRKSRGVECGRYKAVGLACFGMGIFLISQIVEPKYPLYAVGLMIGICVINSYVEASEKKEKEIYDHIATGLAGDYEAMYYIDVETGEYREFAISSEYEKMNVPFVGHDFFAETAANIEKYVYPGDKEFVRELYQKETMLKKLEGRRSYSYKYRVMVDGQPRFFSFTFMRVDDRHVVLREKDIDDEITAENARLADQRKHVTFSQIAESLAINYDVIYYVNAEDSSYISYECRDICGRLDMQKSGDDFFADSRMDIPNLIHKNDCDMMFEFLNREHLIKTLKNQKSTSIDYRLMNGKRAHYARMTAWMSGDGKSFILGIENIDAEVKREKQHLKALNTEKELARRDDLTGVKNKTAYNELEKSVQTNIDNGLDYLPFALILCDANNLKKINDSEGHTAGDEYIKKSSKLLCDVFVHSPVFRVGGDEFVVFVRASDYQNREELMGKLREQVLHNLQTGEGPVLASGMAEFIPGVDSFVTEIFDRADKEMYENKQSLKENEEKTK
ncbi:MAG: GGDEF domain-containing protein [Lachnospiraceae bacterium]|nr:GGDEF domain-containing protein [Lachnospiraceae bacterium]